MPERRTWDTTPVPGARMHRALWHMATLEHYISGLAQVLRYRVCKLCHLHACKTGCYVLHTMRASLSMQLVSGLHSMFPIL